MNNPSSRFASPALGVASKAAIHAPRQRGVVLIMALVILVVLTLLGVTIMNTTSIEAKMATNTQESNRAFQMAESALERVYRDASGLNSLIYPGQSNTASPDVISYSGLGVATVITTYTNKGNKPRRSLDRKGVYSTTDFGTANFEQASTATTTNTGAETLVKQGVSQITPKN